MSKLYVKEIIFFQFQNYVQETRFKLSEVITVFGARNNTGKTTIRRGFSLFKDEVPQVKLLGLITRGKDYSYVKLILSNGTQLEAELNRVRRKGKVDIINVTYNYRDSISKEIIKSWKGYVPEISNLLKWLKISTSTENITLNFKLSGNHLYINTNGMLNTEVLDGLCYDENLDTRIRHVEHAIKDSDEVSNMLDRDLLRAATKRSMYHKTDISLLKDQKRYIHDAREYMLYLKDAKEMLELAMKINKYNTISKLIEELEGVLYNKQKRQLISQQSNMERHFQVLKKIEDTVYKTQVSTYINCATRYEGVKCYTNAVNHILLQKSMVLHLSQLNQLNKSDKYIGTIISGVQKSLILQILKEQKANSVSESLIAKVDEILVKCNNRSSIESILENHRLLEKSKIMDETVQGLGAILLKKLIEKEVQNMGQKWKMDDLYQLLNGRILMKQLVQKISKIQNEVKKMDVLQEYYSKVSLQIVDLKKCICIQQIGDYLQYKSEIDRCGDIIPTCPTCGKPYMGGQLCHEI